MPRIDQQQMLRQEMMTSGYCGRRGGAEEAYDTSATMSYYRPFLYGTPPRLQRWGRRFAWIRMWRLGRWFKN